MLARSLAGGVLSADGAELVLAEWRDPGDTDPPRYIAPLHSHRADDEGWYVLEGVLRFRMDGEELEAPAGGAVIAPRGAVHTYWNPRPATSARWRRSSPPTRARSSGGPSDPTARRETAPKS